MAQPLPEHLLEEYDLVEVAAEWTEAIKNLVTSVTLWQGEFEGHTNTWLRWCDAAGNVIPTGEELAVRAEARMTDETTARQEAEARAAHAEAELARLREEVERLRLKTSS